MEKRTHLAPPPLGVKQILTRLCAASDRLCGFADGLPGSLSAVSDSAGLGGTGGWGALRICVLTGPQVLLMRPSGSTLEEAWFSASSMQLGVFLKPEREMHLASCGVYWGLKTHICNAQMNID